MDKNVDDICNITKQAGGKNPNGTYNRGWQASVRVQENLNLAFFLFHHRCRCTLNGEVTVMHEDTVCLLAGQKRPKDNYKDPDMLPKINKSYMAGTMEAIKEYLRLCYGVVTAPLLMVIT